jgi:hypothetical protein
LFTIRTDTIESTETGFAKFVTFIAYKYFPLTGEDGSINLLICPESIDLYVDSL